MSSIFRRDDNYVEQPKRNTVDMSFQNNLTTRFGALNVCFCKPVMPGESYFIKPTFGLRFQPMVYPVQTRMKASINFFYVRNRNLWKDFPDFIGKTKEDLTPPYIHLTENNRKMIETCELGDYMGLPTKIYDKIYSGYFQPISYKYRPFTTNNEYELDTSYLNLASILSYANLQVGSLYNELFVSGSASNAENWLVGTANPLLRDLELNKKIEILFDPDYSDPNYTYPQATFKFAVFDNNGVCRYVSEQFRLQANPSATTYTIDNIEVTDDWYSDNPSSRNPTACVVILGANNANALNRGISVRVAKLVSGEFDVSEQPLSQLPWRSDSNPNGIPLSALPFRAYESIYNCFYRNAENNPLLINGVPEYNKWLRTQEGGADTNMYPIYYHNWEDDFLTTALPSPQQGNAPLVGLSGTPTLTVAHDDGTTTQMQLTVEDDGTVTGVTAQSGDTPTQNALIDAVSYGITINDFRNVNSFQRWLENNIRRGYKYKDQIKTHYGVSVRYDELDMPEFIGGVSESVMVNQISQTTPTETSPLGDMAGQASAVGQGRAIEHYCDEHGFIIGILCVKPVANYSQLLPKFFNITDSFDYYFPEFGHIGMQPITYAEVTPLQAFKEGKLNDVFGYQRAWYDLIASTDEVHGLFRSDFRNFLINRAFDGTPELGAEFTVMNPDEINDVFAYQGNTDKILGQIYFEASKKTPIPLYGIPRLE